ncbi:MAG: thermonuclease family protein [Actinomycetota bacterium]
MRKLGSTWLLLTCAATLIASCTNVDERATEPFADRDTDRDTDQDADQADDASLARVVKVVDGDTLVVSVQNQIETVRLIGVNTPETVHPTKGVECFGPEASQFTKSTLKIGTVVRLARDDEPRDRYQRLLVYLFLVDGRFFNELLIDKGMARTLSIEPNTAYARLLAQHEARARKNRAGLWSSCER